MNGLEPDDPRHVGYYTIIGRLYVGGNSRVYLAFGSDPATKFVIKMLPRGEEMDPVRRERLRREALYARSVHSTRVAAVVRVGVDAPEPYIVQEYIEGPTLARELADVSGSGLPTATVASLALGLLEGLVDIHAAGVVHRDLKPSNVIMNSRGPVLLDFSISWQYGAERLTETNVVPMTLGYASPEQLAGQSVETPSDIFSWAVVVARAATGRHPFGSDGQHLQAERISSREPDLAGIPDWLRPMLAHSLSKDPAARPSARTLLRDLAARYRDRSSPEALAPTLPEAESLAGSLGESLGEIRDGLRLLRVALAARLRRMAFRIGGDGPFDWADDRTYRLLRRTAVAAGVTLGLVSALMVIVGG